MAFFPGMMKSTSNPVTGLIGKATGTAFDLLDPGKARRGISGLLPGGVSGLNKLIPNIGFLGSKPGSKSGASAAGEDDWRVRLSLADGASIFYKDPATNQGLMRPLVDTNGVIWPYTPQITVTHQANYSTAMLTHSNYPAHFYNYSDVADIQISGEFTVQSIDEGQYLMAVVYFLRSATKMFFGTGENVGNPPPILFLDGYGSHYFPHVPCVITNFTHTLPNEVDYIQVPITSTVLTETPIEESINNFGSVQGMKAGTDYPSMLDSSTQATTRSTQNLVEKAQKTKTGYSSITSSTRVPTVSTVAVTVRPMYSRKNLHERFDLNKFAGGALLADKKKGYGGFI